MILLCGLRRKKIRGRYLGIRYCRRCGRFQHFYLMRSNKQLTLFFVPVFWWTEMTWVGCGICNQGFQINQKEAKRLDECYVSFPNEEKGRRIYEFCVDHAWNQENCPKNWDRLFEQVKERFALNGFDDDFKKLIRNIFAVQEAARCQSKIVD